MRIIQAYLPRRIIYLRELSRGVRTAKDELQEQHQSEIYGEVERKSSMLAK